MGSMNIPSSLGETADVDSPNVRAPEAVEADDDPGSDVLGRTRRKMTNPEKPPLRSESRKRSLAVPAPVVRKASKKSSKKSSLDKDDTEAPGERKEGKTGKGELEPPRKRSGPKKMTSAEWWTEANREARQNSHHNVFSIPDDLKKPPLQDESDEGSP